MKHVPMGKLFLLLLVVVGCSCSAQQAAVTPSPPLEQEIAYFHRTNPAEPAIILGRVGILHPGTETLSVSSAIIALDNKISLADANGNYSIILPLGNHALVVGQIGFYKSKRVVKISQGDSVVLNFNLRYDLRPIND
jgi:hypothetical protein